MEQNIKLMTQIWVFQHVLFCIEVEFITKHCINLALLEDTEGNNLVSTPCIEVEFITKDCISLSLLRHTEGNNMVSAPCIYIMSSLIMHRVVHAKLSL